MKRCLFIVAATISLMALSAAPAATGNAPASAPAKGSKMSASAPTSTPASVPAKGGRLAAPASASSPASLPAGAEAATNLAEQAYTCAVASFINGDRQKLDDDLKAAVKLQQAMTSAQRVDIRYIQSNCKAIHPDWWGNCKLNENNSFIARIWNREFTANYSPTDTSLGYQVPVGLMNGRLQIVVRWPPGLIDSPEPLKGRLATKLGLTQGNLGESVVWHELGHNYVSLGLPLKDVIELYEHYITIFSVVQEFYADMTALYHSTHKSRMTMWLVRIDGIEHFDDRDPHAAAAYAVGLLLLTNVLSDPAKWPSMHLPPKVPDKDVERNTLLYMYKHLDTKWTLAEERALREMAAKFMADKGEGVLRSKGVVPLTDSLSYRMTASDDPASQLKRDMWVARQLKKAIAAGLADRDPSTMPATKPGKRPPPTSREYQPECIEIPHY